MPTVIKLQTEAGNFIKKETWQTCFPVNFEKFLGILFIQNTTRSSRPEVFCKKGGLKNFTKFTTKHLCHSPFFNKVAGLRPTTLLKKRLWHRFFLVNFEFSTSSPKNLENISTCEGWGLTLVAYKKISFIENICS